MSENWTVARARLAANVRYGRPSEVDAARRDLAIARVEKRVADAVAAAPPLPKAVRARLVELIRSVPSTQDGGA